MGKLFDIIMEMAEKAYESKRESLLSMYDLNQDANQKTNHSNQKTDR